MDSNNDSVLGDYVLQLQKQKEEQERKRREQEENIKRQQREEEARKAAELERIRAEEAKKRRNALGKKLAIILSILLGIIILVAGSIQIINRTKQEQEIMQSDLIVQEDISESDSFVEIKEDYHAAKNNYMSVISERKLSYSDLSGKSSEELAIMRNSIYARYGYKFKKQKYQDYFNKCEWYIPSIDDAQKVYNLMTPIERYNVDFIRKNE